MYKFKKERYIEMLDGRTVEWLANKLGYSATTLYLLFNRHNSCKYAFALAIVKALNNDYEVEDYFEKVGNDNNEGR